MSSCLCQARNCIYGFVSCHQSKHEPGIFLFLLRNLGNSDPNSIPIIKSSIMLTAAKMDIYNR